MNAQTKGQHNACTDTFIYNNHVKTYFRPHAHTDTASTNVDC